MKSGVVCVTGGAGYVGLHTAASLLQAGHAVLCIDNLKNSKVTGWCINMFFVVFLTFSSGINRLRERHKNLLFSYCDLRETSSLEEVFGRHNVSLVIHCAGSKNVGESTRIPLEYYHNNVESTISLLQVIEKQEIRRLILSSSSTVYGRAPAPHDEASTPCIPVCPYGNTKMFVETMLRDYCAAADESFQAIVFRYFNPGGAHPTGIVGEDELHTSNLIPLLFEVCLGKRSEFVVFGSDYETSDGTCQRDFFHIMDLAEAHVAAVDFINPGFHVFDLGSGLFFLPHFCW